MNIQIVEKPPSLIEGAIYVVRWTPQLAPMLAKFIQGKWHLLDHLRMDPEWPDEPSEILSPPLSVEQIMLLPRARDLLERALNWIHVFTSGRPSLEQDVMEWLQEMDIDAPEHWRQP